MKKQKTANHFLKMGACAGLLLDWAAVMGADTEKVATLLKRKVKEIVAEDPDFGTCAWKEDELNDYAHKTSCGNTFWEAVTVRPLAIGYCGFCGKNIKEAVE